MESLSSVKARTVRLGGGEKGLGGTSRRECGSDPGWGGDVRSTAIVLDSDRPVPSR